jgi:hypothetical protein
MDRCGTNAFTNGNITPKALLMQMKNINPTFDWIPAAVLSSWKKIKPIMTLKY